MEPGIVAQAPRGHHRGMSTTLYGITNCDTVKRARAWLDEQGIPYRFHDFKKDGVPEAELDRWLRAPGWEALVNRRGTTWRRLDDATRDSVVDAASARAVLLAHPSLIKRPVVNWGSGIGVTTGFDADQWKSHTV
jgi:Spx/MgsR family transcriptional regulator